MFTPAHIQPHRLEIRTIFCFDREHATESNEAFIRRSCDGAQMKRIGLEEWMFRPVWLSI